MNDSFLSLALAAAALAAPGIPLAAQGADTPTAEAILDQVWARYGPAETLAAVENRVFKGMARFEGFGDEGTFVESLLSLGSCAHIRSTLPGFGDFEEGASCGIVWELHPMAAGARIKTGADAMTALRQYALLQHVPWREIYGEVELLGTEKLGEVECYKLKLSPHVLFLTPDIDGGTDVLVASAEQSVGIERPEPDIWFVDRKTMLPRRMDIKMQNPMGSPIELQLELGDWKEVDGILYAHHRKASVQGFVWVQRYDSIEHDVELPDTIFSLPTKVRDAMDATLSHEQPDTSEIRIEKVDERHAAVIRVQCKPEEIGQQMAICLPEVMIHLTSIGTTANGAPFSRYYNYGEPEFDFEAGIPVAEPIEPKGRIEAATLPGGYAVSAWHVGPYEELSTSFHKAQAWIEENGVEVNGAPWEIYWTDPGMEPDPKKWRTQILFPCVAPKEKDR